MKRILYKDILLFALCTLISPVSLMAQTGDEVAAGEKKERGFDRWLNEKPAGLYNNTSFGIVSERGNLFTGMQTAFGYKFNPHLGVGGGIGIERFTNLPTYGNYYTNFTLMPVFAEVRYTVLKSRVSPVIALQGGYKFLINLPYSQTDYYYWWMYKPFVLNESYIWDEYTRGGLFISAEVGVNYKIYKRFGLYASLTYSLWSVSGETHEQIIQTIYMNTPPVVKEWHYTEAVMAYQHIFLFRLGFTF
jgi:hypothetical protein